MKLVSKIEIKILGTLYNGFSNIKELYIGFSKDNILHLITLFRHYDIDYYQGELYFNYEKNSSIFFKVFTKKNDSNGEPLKYETKTFELEDYQTIYKLEIIEKKVSFDNLNNLYEYTIKPIRYTPKVIYF
jgi:hypothetical protein